MKRVVLSVASFLLLPAALPCPAADLTVEVRGVTSMEGEVVVAVFDTAGAWLRKPLKSARVKATSATLTATFEGLPEGSYAVSTYHDRNGNGKLDANVIGIPVEPIGFSNNAVGMMGPASFDDAKLTLPASGTRVVITLRS